MTANPGHARSGTRFVPLGGITIGPHGLQVAVPKEQVKSAPNIELQGEELSRADESRLYHYVSSTTPRPGASAAADSPADEIPVASASAD